MGGIHEGYSMTPSKPEDKDYHAKVHQDLLWHATRGKNSNFGSAIYHDLAGKDFDKLTEFYKEHVAPVLAKNNYPKPPDGPNGSAPAEYHKTIKDILQHWEDIPREKAMQWFVIDKKAEGGKVEPTQDEMRLALSKTNSSKKAQGGTVNAFDYENPKHVTTVAGIASKHRNFNKIPDVAKHLAGALSQGSYKFIEDPRIQSAIKQAGHSGYFINGKEGKQQIVHKAVGGSVLPMEQMKAQMMNRFKGLSTLQSIGAEEAPSLGVKAYVPTVGRPDNGQMPVGGVDTQQGALPVGGIDMNNMQQGQQLMPNAPPSPAGAQQGMDQVPQGDKIPTMDGTGMPPNPNANPNQMGSNILSMTPQGQAMAAMKPQGLKKGGKVEVRPTVFDDKATRRTPEIETAVKALAAGIINQKEYDRIVQKYKPVKAYDFVPAPATDEDAMRALNKTQQAKWRGHESWPAGHPVGLRLDIPSYERHGVWVNSIHDESNDEESRPTSYAPVSAVRNATFEGTPHKAMRVATGEQSKSPFARIKGELEHIDEKSAVAHMKKFLNHPEYRQIGYDPRRHGDFYDRETMKPVQSSEHVVQIGPLVLAKNPVYGKKRTQYATGGSTKGYVKSTPKKPHPEVGTRFTATPQGNLVAPQVFDIMKHENKGSIVPVPYDATTRDNLVTEVSGHQLTEPLLTEAGFDYAMDPKHVAQAIGGASNLGIAGRVQDRINQAAREHDGDVFLAPNTMSEKAENFSHHPAHIVLDLMKQRQLNKKTLKALSDDLRSQPEIHPTTKKKIFPYKNFVGFDHPNLGEQVMKGGHGLETTAGNLRKKMMDRLSLVNIQELLDYNLGDLKASILHPDIASDPKGYMGRTLVKAQAGAPLRLSRHKSYDTDYTGTYAGGIGNRPIETVMPDLYEEVEAELKQRPVKKAKSDTEYRNQVIGALEKRKERVAQPINARVINNAGLYEEGLRQGEFDPKNLESVLAYYKRKGGYKAGGKVKLHTDQDTMQLALTKKSKKAK